MSSFIFFKRILHNRTKDLTCMRIVQEIIIVLIINYVTIVFGSPLFKIDIFILLGINSVGYLILWQMWLNRNEENCRLFLTCGYSSRQIFLSLAIIFFCEFFFTYIIGNIIFVLIRFVLNQNYLKVYQVGIILVQMSLAYTISFLGIVLYWLYTKRLYVGRNGS